MLVLLHGHALGPMAYSNLELTSETKDLLDIW